MLLLIPISITRMSTLKHLCTTSSCLILTLPFITHILVDISNYRTTKSTLLGIFLFFVLGASFAQVIGLFFARLAKIIATIVTSNSIDTHVLSMRFCYIFSLVIFDIKVHLSFQNFNHIPTLALHNVLIIRHYFLHDLVLQVI